MADVSMENATDPVVDPALLDDDIAVGTMATPPAPVPQTLDEQSQPDQPEPPQAEGSTSSSRGRKRPSQVIDRLNRHDACRTCRLKKRKCDGRRPVCNRCLKSVTDGVPWPKCVYDERIVNVAEEVANLTVEVESLLVEMASLKDRIAFLEHQVLEKHQTQDTADLEVQRSTADPRKRGSSAPPLDRLAPSETVLGKRKA